MPFDQDNSYKQRLSSIIGFDPIDDSEELARPGPAKDDNIDKKKE